MSKPPRIAMAIAFAPMVSPWLGSVARLLTARPWNIALIGVGLWLASCAAMSYLQRFPEVAKGRNLGVSILVWTLTFVPLFTVTALATGLLVRH
jgi:hypothetical protein